MDLDHLVIAAERLDEGAAWLEDLLGIDLQPGGRHEAMGTHNRLCSLGPALYLEVIAVDPETSRPAHARWYGLDDFSGPPRLVAWAARVADLEAALRQAPEGAGRIHQLARGDLRWRMAVPESGHLPFDGLYPALIAWQTSPLPPKRLPETGLQLEALSIVHPDAAALAADLAGLTEPALSIETGPHPVISARVMSASGKTITL